MTTVLVGEPLAQCDTGLTLEHRPDGQLWAIQGAVERAVQVRRAFPWSEPGRFLSLRDADDAEVALVTISRSSSRARAARSNRRWCRRDSCSK